MLSVLLMMMSNEQCLILYLLLTGQTLTFHGVLVIDRELGEELPASLQCSFRPRDWTLTLRDELHVLHGLKEGEIYFNSSAQMRHVSAM